MRLGVVLVRRRHGTRVHDEMSCDDGVEGDEEDQRHAEEEGHGAHVKGRLPQSVRWRYTDGLVRTVPVKFHTKLRQKKHWAAKYAGCFIRHFSRGTSQLNSFCTQMHTSSSVIKEKVKCHFWGAGCHLTAAFQEEQKIII